MKAEIKESTVIRTVVGKAKTEVYDPALRNSSSQYLSYHSGWTTIETEIVRVEGEPRKKVIPGLAADIVTGIEKNPK